MDVRYATLAYGGEDAIYRQASMLLLSLLAYAPSPRELVAVTDHPAQFRWFDGIVRTERVTPAQLRSWQGPAPFSMRAKLEAARAIAPSGGALVLLDADTVARADLSPFTAALAGGALFMHRREFELGTSARRGNRALWEALRGRAFGGWEFRPEEAMWNSGVIAMSAADVTLVNEALALYDAMDAAGVRHFATEQLVLGLVLQRTGRLREAAPWFTHYWGNKKNYDAEIAARLNEAIGAGLTPHDAAEDLRLRPIALPAESRPGRIEKMRRWVRRFARRAGQRDSV